MNRTTMKKGWRGWISLTFALVLFFTGCQSNVNETDGQQKSDVSTTDGQQNSDVSATDESEQGHGLDFTGKVVYYNTPSELKEMTGIEITEYHQSPMLDDKDLPPVEERLPENPLVVQGTTEIGSFGGELLLSGPDGERGDSELGLSGGITREFVNDVANYIPNLFESFEHNEDYTEWSGTLRKGLRWSDGEPLTTEDMVFCQEAIIADPDVSPGGNSDWEDSQGNLPILTVTDDITFKYTFPAPNSKFYHSIFRPWSPFIVPKHALVQFHPKYDDGAIALSEEYNHISWMDTLGRAMEGALEGFITPGYSPWVRTEFVEGQLEVWERNPYYWQVDPAGNQLPYIDTLRYSVQEDENALIMSAASGDIDFLKGERIRLGVNYTTVKEYEEQGNYTLVPARGATMFYGVVYFNHDHPTEPKVAELFGQIEFKQALSFAMDREEISNTLFKGIGTPTQFCPAGPFKDDDSVWTDFTVRDVGKANELLDNLGYAWDTNHEYRTFPDGSRLELSAMAENDSTQLQIAQMYAQQWKDIGVSLIVKGFGDDAFGNKWDTMDYDLMIREVDISEIEMSAPWSVYAEAPEEVIVAPAWGRWLITEGQEGTEPPKYWKQAYDFTEAARGMTEEEFTEGMVEHYKSFAKNMIILTNISITAPEGLDSKYLISNRVGNHPEVPCDQEASYMAGETFYIK